MYVYTARQVEEEQWKWLKVSRPVATYDISRFYYQKIN